MTLYAPAGFQLTANLNSYDFQFVEIVLERRRFNCRVILEPVVPLNYIFHVKYPIIHLHIHLNPSRCNVLL